MELFVVACMVHLRVWPKLVRRRRTEAEQRPRALIQAVLVLLEDWCCH